MWTKETRSPVVYAKWSMRTMNNAWTCSLRFFECWMLIWFLTAKTSWTLTGFILSQDLQFNFCFPLDMSSFSRLSRCLSMVLPSMWDDHLADRCKATNLSNASFEKERQDSTSLHWIHSENTSRHLSLVYTNGSSQVSMLLQTVTLSENWRRTSKYTHQESHRAWIYHCPRFEGSR